MSALTLARLNAVLSYDAKTGLLCWRIDRPRGVRAGDIAGTINRCGYVQVGIGGKNYLGHRLAWMLCHQCEMPSMQIDHVNGMRADNRASNLRLATCAENRRNSRPRANASGLTGVTWRARTQRWEASITINGRAKFLGYFVDKSDAGRAYAEAAKAEHGLFFREAS